MGTTADATDVATEKMDTCDHEVKDSCSTAHKGDAQKETIRALRMLFEDFADQVQYQDEIQEESASESEPSRERTQVADSSSHCTHVLPFEERADVLQPRREPQLYLCDDWIQPMGVVRRPKELTTKTR